MYNEELKTKFLNSDELLDRNGKLQKNLGLYKKVFDVFEKHEEEWGADLCTRKSDDLVPIISDLSGFREDSKRKFLYPIQKYVRWCMRNGVQNVCDEITKVRDFGAETMRLNSVANPKHLQKYLNDFFAPESKHTADDVSRCFFWLAFGGLTEDEIFNVTCSDVDFEEMVVHSGDKTAIIYREALPAFRNCVNLQQFAYNHPNYQKVTWIDRVEGDLLLRGTVPKRLPRNPINGIQKENFRTALSKRLKLSGDKRTEKATNSVRETVVSLTYFKAWMSGLFYLMYEAERSGEIPDFEPIARQRMEDYKKSSGKGKYQFSPRNTEDHKRKQVSMAYKKDYERWKLAHQL